MTTASSIIIDDPTRKRLGRIFIDKGLLTETAARRMAAIARERKTLFGTFLEQIGLVTPEELAEALAIHFNCKMARDFARLSYPPLLLRMLPIEAVVEHTVFPLKLENGKLALAAIDPANTKLFDEIAQKHNVQVTCFVATRNEINRAIARHYMERDIDSAEKTILLVEDDELIRTAVSDVLKKHGYAVETATDPMAAFKIIFVHKPMLIITDKIMPKLGGYEFLDAVKRIPEFRFTPVILMTANACPDEEQVAFDKGFFDIILKPVKEVSLVKRVQRAIQSVDSVFRMAS
jgi:CheY-like chemotaxis protein